MPDEAAIHRGLNSVIACFPQKEALVRELFLTDPTFQSICEDYRLALDGLERFDRIAAVEPSARAVEYQALVRELEAELQRAMDAAARREAQCQ